MSREMSLIGCKHALRGLPGVTNLHTFGAHTSVLVNGYARLSSLD